MGLLLFGIAACSSKPAEKGGGVDDKVAAGFARAVDAAAGADPVQSPALLARGTFESVAPSEKCLESFAAADSGKARVEALLDCGLGCTLEAVQALKGKEPRTWMAELGRACEPAHFGLREYGTWILSPEWFLLHKVAELSAPRVAAASGESKAALDKAMASLRLPMPLPAVAPRLYELPVVPAEVSVPITTRTYVVVPEEGSMRVGATPIATLGARGATMAAPEGQALFPGNEASSFDLEPLVLEAVGQTRTPAPSDAAPVEGLPPGLHGEVTKTLRGDFGQDGEPVALLLADGRRSAAEVVGVATTLRQVLVAVASPEDTAARALVVDLKSELHSQGEAPGQARIDLGPGGLEAAKKAAAGTEEEVVIKVEENVPWSDAVTVAAVAIARGAKRIAFASPRLYSTARSGWGASSAFRQSGPAASVVTEGEVTVTGGELSQAVIHQLLRRRFAVFRACYEKELAANPALAGQVEIAFTIGADGAVGKAKGTGLPVVSDCVARQVRAIKFPRPNGGAVSVRYPLTFKPKDPT
jgi:hypothetical protein